MFNASLETRNLTMTAAVFLGTYLVTLALGRLLKRRAGVRLGIFYQLFCLTLAFYAALKVYGLEVPWRGHVGAALVLLTTGVVVALLNRYLWDYYFEKRRQVVIPKLLRDTVAMGLFLIALLLVLSIGYQAQTQLKGVLAGSGVLAIILGFAAQNFLSSLVAGMSLQIERPYKVGDWLKIGEIYGEVMEIRWGATRVRTNDAISLHIPNNEIVKQTITNLNYPSAIHAMRITVGADYGMPPNRVKDALMRATTQAKGVLMEPPPRIFLKDYGDSAVLYEIKFNMTNHAFYNEVCDAIRTNVWYEFKRRKIKIPFPIRTLHIERKSRDSNADTTAVARAILRKEALFSCLGDEQIELLLKDAEANHFGRGEAVIEEGTDGNSMFILLRGSAQVSIAKNGSLLRVGVLRQGDCFGEMSLLTGEKRSATVRAEKDCEVLEISKPVMGDVLRNSPECLSQLSGLLAHRKIETEGIVKEAALAEGPDDREREYTATFLTRLRSFFEL
ncbi:MAG: mechanosensitive ion channel family protein [Chthoniobacterales bacterium]|nr:mechanosensitive ion channel family protein [Chthoniobacterales bacterium]